MSHVVAPGARSQRVLIVVLVLSVLSLGLPGAASAHPIPFANPAFERIWAATDQAVASGEAQRSWLWGPAPFAYSKELYLDAAGLNRLVQYFDKSRMEINYPNSDSTSPWYVTNGLLVKEMVFGKRQVGDSQFISGPTVTTPIAGDPDVASTPGYNSFSRVATWDGSGRVDDRTGQPVTDWIDAFGEVRQGDTPREVRFAYYESALGHNIADVFWEWMNDPANGILSYGSYVYPMGYPISEPYWVQARVAGVERAVLVQLFERRVLTYTPDNPDGWQIEMGNVGRAYYQWIAGDPRDLSPRWSADGGQILFTSTRDGNSDLFTVGADGSQLRQLTRTVDSESGARWHPDGRVVFERGARTYLMTPDAAGTNLQEWRYLDSQWAPDGRVFSYIGVNAQQPELRVQRIPDGAEQVVFRGNDIPVGVIWSPDSQRLAFLTLPITQQAGAGMALWTVDADGSHLTRLTPEGWTDLTDVAFSWAPDSARLTFFVSKKDQAASPLYVVGADGTQLQAIAPSARGSSPPSWSPAGNVILFQPGDDASLGLWAIQPDGSGLSRVGGETIDHVRQFAWSPTGDRIAAIREVGKSGSELWVLTADGAQHWLADRPPAW